MAGIEFSKNNGLARIILNRPERRNALAEADWRDLRQAAQDASGPDVRAVVISGAGGAFSAGFDIAGIVPDKTDAFELVNSSVNPALRAIRDIAVPTIAAVDGVCVGGGFGIAAACDIVLASEVATFGVPYSNIGIMADAGLHVFLREAVGYQQASYLIMSGKIISAAEALDMRICAEVHSSADFDDAVQWFAQGLSSGPTQALIRSKSVLRSATESDEGYDLEARLQAEVFRTDDAAEGIDAFLKRRKPKFIGS